MKKPNILLAATCAFAVSAVFAGPLEDLLPRPRRVEARAGVAEGAALDAVRIVRGTVPGAPADLVAEGYVLDIAPGGVTVTASDPRGERYARVTLDQLRALAGGRVPCCRIVDWPTLRWRGFMNDCGRNYLELDAVKAIVDVMARYKMNLFHWHLTDYHGWRLESKRHPQLQRPAAFLRQVGRYYTQDEFREIVAYAAARGVTVMPELDVPGHTLSLRRGLGIDSMGAPGTDRVVRELFEELCSLAPADVMPFVHLGTDEVRTAPEYCDKSWVSVWARAVNGCGRKAVVWGPGEKLDAGLDVVDMAWHDNHITNSVNPVFDAARMYNGSWTPLQVAPRAAFTKPCRWAVAPGRQIGALTCTWHDDNCGEDNVRLFRDAMVLPSIVAFADNYWSGRERDLSARIHRLPKCGEDGFAVLEDLERRMAAQRDAFFADFRYPFPFLRQTHMRWRVTDEKGAVLATDVPQGSWREDGSGYVAQKPGLLTVETWIDSPADIACGAWIDLTCYGCAYGRPGLSGSTPARGQWNTYGGEVFLNEEPVPPPHWALPGRRATTRRGKDQDVPYSDDLLEQPFADEGCVRRAPTPIRLKKGVNHVKIVFAAKKPGSVILFALFSPLMGTSEHPREVPGLRYAASPEGLR